MPTNMALAAKVEVTWTLSDRRVTLLWRESGGPELVAPTRQGFGSILADNVVRQLKGAIRRTWEPNGLLVEVIFPL